jgi:fatty acid desaturase
VLAATKTPKAERALVTHVAENSMLQAMDDGASNDSPEPVARATLERLQRRSNTKGLLRLAGHLLAIASTGYLTHVAIDRGAPLVLVLVALSALGFTLATMFAAMHEAVHRTAFQSRALNDAVAWFAGLLSFYNSSFYRPYHGWHHRYTQLPGRDPELDDPKPVGLTSYLRELSGLPWWLGKLRTHLALAAGLTARYPFLTERSAPGVVRSVRLQLAVYGAGIALSVALGRPYFVLYWLVPVALGQPWLRAILLAEHTGCSLSTDAFTNTRTTYTAWPVRFLMWEMPYHAEHHYYPALPFFSLAEAHETLGPRLAHVARHGYFAFNLGLLRDLGSAAP